MCRMRADLPHSCLTRRVLSYPNCHHFTYGTVLVLYEQKLNTIGKPIITKQVMLPERREGTIYLW
jgi:hypothetical protein